MKITVNRKQLIAVIQKRKEEAVTNWKKELANYPAAVKAETKKYLDGLRAHIKAVEAGTADPWKYSYNFPHINLPSKPLEREDLITARFDKQLDKLALSTDENLIVDDKSDFFQFI